MLPGLEWKDERARRQARRFGAALLLLAPLAMLGCRAPADDEDDEIPTVEVQGNAPVKKGPDRVARLRTVVQKNPNSAQAHSDLADEYMRRNLIAQAFREYDVARHQDPRDPRARQGIAEVAARMAPAKALAAAQAAVQRDPHNLEALANLGRAQAQLGRPQDAARTFGQLVQQRPADVGALLSAAAASAEARDWQKAEGYCRQAIQAAPGNAQARLLLAAVFMAQKRPNEAAVEVERLVREHPESAALQDNLGHVRTEQGRVDEALAAFRQAQRLRPEWAQPYLSAGTLLYRQHRIDDAEGELRKALERAPDAVLANLGLAEIAEVRGQTAQAITYYEKVLMLQPTLYDPLNNLAYHYAEQGQQIDRAVQLARRAAQLYPGRKEVWDTLGWVCYQAGRREEGLEYLRKAAQLMPETGSVHYHLAKALQAAGRRDEAATAYRAALARALNPDEKKDAEAGLAATRT